MPISKDKLDQYQEDLEEMHRLQHARYGGAMPDIWDCHCNPGEMWRIFQGMKWMLEHDR